EEENGLQTKLQQLRDFLSSSQSEKVDEMVTEVLNSVKGKRLDGLSKSNIKILKEIEGYTFAGNGLVEHVNNLISNGGYKTTQRFDEFLRLRNEFMGLVNRT